MSIVKIPAKTFVDLNDATSIPTVESIDTNVIQCNTVRLFVSETQPVSPNSDFIQILDRQPATPTTGRTWAWSLIDTAVYVKQSGVDPEPVNQGVQFAENQSATIPQETIGPDDRVEIEYIYPSQAVGCILSNNDGTNYLNTLASGQPFEFETNLGTGFGVNGSTSNGQWHSVALDFSITSGSVVTLIDNSVISTEVTLSTLVITQIGKLGLLPTWWGGRLRNLKIYKAGVLTRHYPMNDDTSSGVMLDVVGGINGSYVGF